MNDPTFFLSADSLMSKWGFGDGDALSDWWWDNFDEPTPFDEDDVLFALVETYLVPKLRDAGWTVELTRIHTIHNPVRAETLNGEEVDWYDVGVWVTREQILAANTRETQ